MYSIDNFVLVKIIGKVNTGPDFKMMQFGVTKSFVLQYSLLEGVIHIIIIITLDIKSG